MTRTRVDNYGEWRALVASWALGIANADDNLRSTAKQEELEEVMRVDREAKAAFADREMSAATMAYADMLASNSQVAPRQYPAVILWDFQTIPFAGNQPDDYYFFLGGSVTVVTRDDLN